jgi:hypothetical protein
VPLELLTPPALVSVRGPAGEVLPALLLGRRDGRSYLQVSRGPGDNVLRWLPSADVAPAAPGAATHPPLGSAGDPGRPVPLRTPRAGR